jgi:hypothetical protein
MSNSLPAVRLRRHLVQQKLGVQPSPGYLVLRFSVGFHEPRQPAIALVPYEAGAMLLAAEVAQRQLSEYRQFMAAN